MHACKGCKPNPYKKSCEWKEVVKLKVHAWWPRNIYRTYELNKGNAYS